MAQKEKIKNEIILRPCNQQQLARAYGVSSKVMTTWLKPYRHQLGERVGYKYNLEQLLIIIEKIGEPQFPIITCKSEKKV